MEKECLQLLEAIDLEELGFKVPCLGYFDGDGEFKTERFPTSLFHDKIFVSTPLYQQAFKWFMDEFELYGIPAPRFHSDNSLWFVYEIIQPNKNSISELNSELFRGSFMLYKTMEEAKLECIKEMILICKRKIELIQPN